MSTEVQLSLPEQSTRPPGHILVGLGGLLFFGLIAALVHLRLLVGIDLVATEAKQALVRPVFDAIGEASAIAVSAELGVVYAAIATFLLWRAGVGRWSVAPFAFALLEPVEFALKLLVNQPPVPSEFYRGIYYPLTTIVLQGSFPSGHAMRGAFLGAFVVILLRARGGKLAMLGSVAAILFATLNGFFRIYLGFHWLSDVVAGLILGASLALVVVPPVVQRLISLPRRGDGRSTSESVE